MHFSPSLAVAALPNEHSFSIYNKNRIHDVIFLFRNRCTVDTNRMWFCNEQPPGFTFPFPFSSAPHPNVQCNGWITCETVMLNNSALAFWIFRCARAYCTQQWQFHEDFSLSLSVPSSLFFFDFLHSCLFFSRAIDSSEILDFLMGFIYVSRFGQFSVEFQIDQPKMFAGFSFRFNFANKTVDTTWSKSRCSASGCHCCTEIEKKKRRSLIKSIERFKFMAT